MPSFDIVSIFIVNEDPSCPSTTVENQVSFDTCSETYIVRISAQSNAAGPFSIYTGATSGTPVFSAVSRTDLVAGQSILLYNADQTDCATPTPTPTPTVTPTPTQSPVSPSPTPTPTVTPTTTTTPTVTPTPSVTPTVTPTTTVTPTVTPSITISVTPTQTVTPTPSITPTITPTTSVTPTITPTPTLTPTTTTTPTVTPSITPTTTITPSITPTITPSVTATITPTPTITPTVTPSEAGFLAYIFAEPQDFNDGVDIENYMTVDNDATWGGYQFYGTPGTSDYSTNLDIYAHYSAWTSNTGNYISAPTILSSTIRQSAGSGTDSYGCSQNQYTFGTIEITTSDINPSIQYHSSIWIPLDGVGGSMSNMTVDIGSGAACSFNIQNDGIPDSIAAGTNVVVTSGAVIPAGTYRVLWLGSTAVQPTTPPLTGSVYFKGDTKT